MLEVVEITYCHLITGHSAAGGQFTAQWTRIEKATQMETDLHRVKWGTTKWSRRIGEEQVARAGLVGGSMARPCGREGKFSGRDPSNPLLPPLSLAQGTQRLAAEALKTAIKTPLMDGSTLGGV